MSLCLCGGTWAEPGKFCKASHLKLLWVHKSTRSSLHRCLPLKAPDASANRRQDMISNARLTELRQVASDFSFLLKIDCPYLTLWSFTNADQVEARPYFNVAARSLIPSHLSYMLTAMLRHTRFVVRQTTRRHASTTEAAKDTTVKSKEAVSNASSKTSQGLSRVTSSAGPAVSGAAQGVSKAIGNIGGRTGRTISFVQCESEPIISSLDYSAHQLRRPEVYLRNNGQLIL